MSDLDQHEPTACPTWGTASGRLQRSNFAHGNGGNRRIPAACPGVGEGRLSTEAVRKPFRAPSGRKIDSNGTPHTHQSFAEAATSILLLRANNHFERFHTACTQMRHSR